MRGVGGWLSALAVGAAVVVSTPMASPGTAPSPNGRIAFTGDWAEERFDQIFRVDVATGSQVNLTRSESFGGSLAAVSPDGSTILFVRGSIWRMDADGGRKKQLAPGWAPVWSPDGKRIAYTDERGSVATMAADGSDKVRLVPGRLPIWSPDGRWIAYVDGSPPLTVMVVGADGSGARPLYSTTDSFLSVLWSPDATHVTVAADDVIVAAPVTGGAVRVLATDVSGLREPQWSPDGSRIAFARAGQLFTMSAAGGDSIALTPARSPENSPGEFVKSPKWSPDGRSLAFIRATAIPRSRRFSEEIWIVPAGGGVARQVTSNMDDHTAKTRFSWANDGRSLVYSTAFLANRRGVLSVQPDGTKLSRLALGAREPAFSPDGHSIAFTVNATTDGSVRGELFVVRADGTGVRQLTHSDGQEGSPSWSPDGSRIVFTRFLPNQRRQALYTIQADGTRLTRIGAPSLVHYNGPAWSPDGGTIVVVRDGGALISMDADGRRAKRIAGFAVSTPGWSPSGDRISFVRYGGKQFDLWTIGPRGGKPRKLIAGVHDAAWSPDGTRLAVVEAVNRNVHIFSSKGKLLRKLGVSGSHVSWQPICTRAGGPRADRLSGNASSELICGLGGADRITGGRGRDRLFGGDGNDSIDAGGGGFDVVGCGPGADTVLADGADYVGVDCERVTRR